MDDFFFLPVTHNIYPITFAQSFFFFRRLTSLLSICLYQGGVVISLDSLGFITDIHNNLLQ